MLFGSGRLRVAALRERHVARHPVLDLGRAVAGQAGRDDGFLLFWRVR